MSLIIIVGKKEDGKMKEILKRLYLTKLNKQSIRLQTIALLFLGLCFWQPAHGQTIEALKSKRDSLTKIRNQEKQVLAKIDKTIDSLKNAIKIQSGWIVQGGGLLGLNFSFNDNWIGNANPNSFISNLSVGLNCKASLDKKKGFWNSSGTLNLNWQGIDEDRTDDDRMRFLENRTTDVLNLSSLYGYRFNKSIALSGLVDLNTSTFRFLNPGSLDLSTGVTWKPRKISNLAMVVHFLTYHIAFSEEEANIGDVAANGVKFKLTYAKNFSKAIKWNTNFNSFVPYNGSEEEEPSLFEYSWINSINFKLWKAIGIGMNAGVRLAEFEIDKTQWFNTLGVSYSL